MCPQLGQNYVHIEHIEYLLSESIDCIDYVTGIGNTIQTPAYSTLHLLCIFNGQLLGSWPLKMTDTSSVNFGCWTVLSLCVSKGTVKALEYLFRAS